MRAFIDTYGCQQNVADSERIEGLLRGMGYAMQDEADGADVVVLNTCAVREHAEHRALGNIGALIHVKRKKPEMVIAVCGCMMERPEMVEKIRNSYRHVDLVFGTRQIPQFPILLRRAQNEVGRVFVTGGEDDPPDEGLPVARRQPPGAWIPIMAGCDNFCSYCIVPYTRGRERSRTPDAVVEEVQDLIGQGYREFTLLGQNVNSYGYGFAKLLRQLCALDGEFWLRFMTSHPKDASEDLFQAMADSPKVARHLHLPVQAGSDRVLRTMNRGYYADEYIQIVALARRYMPDLTLTSDVIVGFPGETEPEFEQTLQLIKTVRFDALFTFLYSSRSGTPAADMPDPVGRDEKQRWFDRLLETQNQISLEKSRAYVGQTVRALSDHTGLAGRTGGNRLVRFDGKTECAQFTQARITDCNPWSLTGEVI